jgi:hypothetical protein
MKIAFSEDLTDEQKVQILFNYYNVTETIDIKPDDYPLIVLALNQDDVASVIIDEEKQLVIEYYGDTWDTSDNYE